MFIYVIPNSRFIEYMCTSEEIKDPPLQFKKKAVVVENFPHYSKVKQIRFFQWVMNSLHFFYEKMVVYFVYMKYFLF